MEALDKLGPIMERVLSRLQQARAVADPDSAAQLELLQGQLQQYHGQFLAEVQKANAVAERQLADAQRIATESLQKVEQERQRLAALRAAPPPAPPTPIAERATDPTLGRKVAAELFHRFGAVKPAVAAADPGSLWPLLQDIPMHAAAPPPAAPRPTAPPSHPPAQAEIPSDKDASLWPFLDFMTPPEESDKG